MTDLLHNPIVRGIVSGVAAAAVVDVHSFMAWKSFSEAASYSWSTAAVRWLQGAVMGAITGAGFGSFVA